MLRWYTLILLVALGTCGCSYLPRIAHQPIIHNPFPQLSKVAIAPFFNLSAEPAADGRQFALAYFNALQALPGFEVVPVGVVEAKIAEHKLSLAGPEDARYLAQLLGVDAVVIGAITDYSPYYPPRCGLQVEWYAANPCYHPIPPGYGLPWSTPDEEQIPPSLVFEAEMALARAQLKTQTPSYQVSLPADSGDNLPEEGSLPPGEGQEIAYHTATTGVGGTSATIDPSGTHLPLPWPDPRGFIPPPPSDYPADCQPSQEPVLTHTAIYNGNSADFTEALASYYYFQDEARFGGWQSYMQRSDDFIRFCCHLHIAEMLTARGGAGETRVVWRWPARR